MSKRLTYSFVAAHGRVLMQWSEPQRRTRMAWADAYKLAKVIEAVAKRAEIQAGLTVDRTTPQRVDTVFTPSGGFVKIDWGVTEDLFDWAPAEAFAIANALVVTGETAQRWGQQGPSMTPREVEQIEEVICGKPQIIKESVGRQPTAPVVPEVKDVYYYRPADCMGTVLNVFPNESRANILLTTGAILEGIAWADLFREKPVIAGVGMGIPSEEAHGRASLGGSA